MSCLIGSELVTSTITSSKSAFQYDRGELQLLGNSIKTRIPISYYLNSYPME